MEPLAASYKPSPFNVSKYLIYADYFKEYIRCGDFKSLGISLKYMFTHKLAGHDYTTKSRMGTFNIRKGTTDFQFINFAYERPIKRYIRKHLDSFDVFIDIGACIGEYCIWLALQGKKCVAVEPVNFEAVRKNVSLNKLEEMVKVFPYGMGSKNEKVYFNIPTGLPSSSYMDKDTNKEPNAEIKTLDSLYESFGMPNDARILVKLDVEGMETEVIAGARNFINKYKNISFIFEHFETDDYKNDKALSAMATFKFTDIDKVNRLAIKV